MKKIFVLLSLALISASASASTVEQNSNTTADAPIYSGILGSFQKGDAAVPGVAGIAGTPATPFSAGTPGTPGTPSKAEIQRVVGSFVLGTVLGGEWINVAKNSTFYTYAVEGEAIKLSSSTVLTVGLPVRLSLDFVGMESSMVKVKAAIGSGMHGQLSLAYEQAFSTAYGSPVVLTLGVTKLSGHDIAPQIGAFYQF